jgi:hypothetical protein
LVAVPLRRTYRSQHTGPPPSDGQLVALQQAANAEDCHLIDVRGEPAAVLDEMVASAEHEFPDSTARYGLHGAWIRRDNASVRTVLLATDNDTSESWIRAGAGLQLVLLEATYLELARIWARCPLKYR